MQLHRLGHKIKSFPLFPAIVEAMFPGDPPKGCAVAERTQRIYDRVLVASEPWPELPVGTELEIETTNHWIWRATIEEVRDADHWVVRAREKQPMPLPPIVEGKPYILPHMSGDGWSTLPKQGQILEIGGAHYKVTHKPKSVRSGFEYRLAPVTAAAHAKRQGRVSIKDLVDADYQSPSYYAHNVGRVIEIDGEWLHVEKVERPAYGDAEGRETFGHNTIGVGHFVPAAKAKKLQVVWEAKKKVRSIEHGLKVFKQDLDYGGRPEAVPALEAELAQAREALRELDES